MRAAVRLALLAAIGALACTDAVAQASPTVAHPARREPAPKAPAAIAAGLAEDTVEVKVNYSGAKIVLFATSPSGDDPNTGFAVALIGPSTPHAVTHNTSGGSRRFQFVSAPGVFAIAAEPQVAATISPEVMTEAGLNVESVAIPKPDKLNSPDLPAWRAAFVKLMIEKKLYSVDDAAIEKLPGGLRRARINLPPNSPPGIYQVRAVAFRNGQKIGETNQKLTLVRGGADATLFDLSRKHGFVYGFLAVLVACLVGAVATWVGRR